MFADVILPLPLSDLFTYSVPEEMRQKIGKGHRVIVPFGTRKHYTAIVRRLHNDPPIHFEVKEIHSSIDPHPVVDEQQMRLWEWISFYYLSPLGDVYKAALPPSMKPEDLQIGFTPRTETYIRLNPEIKDASEEELTRLFSRAKKQQALFLEIQVFLDKQYNINKKEDNKEATGSKKHSDIKKPNNIAKKKVMEFYNYSPYVLNELIKKGVLQSFDIEVESKKESLQTCTPHRLNNFQQQALRAIREHFGERQTCLLHGVTSSGKTEIYIHLVKEYIEKGMQVLYLVPEIALTTQLTQRLKKVFGDKMAVYHSKINNRERVEIWKKMQSDEAYDLILGARSSLFLPYVRLGLIIVDEEHETSYKQQDPAPRYHARDTAIMLSHFAGAKTLLGSATPSLESYHNAKKGKYGLVNLNMRYGNLMMPEILIEDTYDLRKRKKMKSLLSPILIEKINGALANGEQVILFRNRRGFASWIECKQCGWIPKCDRCDVSLTYHKVRNKLVCHYCNASYTITNDCPTCQNKDLKPLGIGTERLEEEVSLLFPDAVIARMDTDATRNKYALEQVINDFHKNKIQILIGTQMLSKGLDFENVKVVGIVSADSLLNRPDFRSHERGFQLILQAAGRAGRKNKRGYVVIQSNDPEQPIYKFIRENDFENFYRFQLNERKLFNYPPFSRLIRVTFKHKNESIAKDATARFATSLRTPLQERVLGPNSPVVNRVQQYHIREILLKLEYGLPTQPIRDLLQKTEKEMRAVKRFRYVLLYYDVDPV